jgi:hypothetical protein
LYLQRCFKQRLPHITEFEVNNDHWGDQAQARKRKCGKVYITRVGKECIKIQEEKTERKREGFLIG